VAQKNQTCHNKENVREGAETCMSLHNGSNEIDPHGYLTPLHIMMRRIAWGAHLRLDMVLECLGKLNDLGRNNKVTLLWVPGASRSRG